MGVGRQFVVVTGLPASGKTTVARGLSDSLGLPLLDKDDILETLFEAFEVRTAEDRARLSRASDAVLETLARASQGAVLCSFWRAPRRAGQSGTPVDWIAELTADVVVEVACVCDPTVAARRFASRERHPSHLDGRHTEDELRAAFSELALDGPIIDLDPLIVDTDGPVDVERLAALVRDRTSRR
ncbi:MAG TPA: AAA family ATPase [Candidatus Nanopelagicales bacterium]|nr:AAA family ATPase [Candidatus Nanopelagicales bacterium]